MYSALKKKDNCHLLGPDPLSFDGWDNAQLRTILTWYTRLSNDEIFGTLKSDKKDPLRAKLFAIAGSLSDDAEKLIRDSGYLIFSNDKGRASLNQTRHSRVKMLCDYLQQQQKNQEPKGVQVKPETRAVAMAMNPGGNGAVA